MKRVKSVVVVFLLFAGFMSTSVKSSGTSDYTKAEITMTARKFLMKINGQPFKLDISPIWDTQTNLFLIPLRTFAGVMNYDIDWNQPTATASFRKGDSFFQLKLEDKKATLITELSLSHYQSQLKNNRILLDSLSIEKLMNIQARIDTDNLEITFYTDRNKINLTAADFTLKDIAGKDFKLYQTLNSGKYKLVLINFYATRCPICATALPNLVKLYEDYKNKGILVIGINTDTANMEKDRDAIIAKYKISYPVLLDKKAEIYTLYSVSGIPNLFVINQKGEIVQHQLGVEADYFTFLRTYIDQIIK